MMKKWMIIFGLGVMGSGILPSCYEGVSLDTSLSSYSERDVRRERRSRKRSSNQCEDSSRCQILCDQILDYTSERRECYRLSLKEIGTIQDVFEQLYRPTPSRLGEITSRGFEVFAEFALESWAGLIIGHYRRVEQRNDDDDEYCSGIDNYDCDSYNGTMSQNVLNWALQNKWVGEDVRDFSDVDEVWYNLFRQVGDENSGLSLSGSSLASPHLCRSGALSTNVNAGGSGNNVRIELSSSVDAETVRGIVCPYSAAGSFLKQVTSDVSVQPMYDSVHNILSQICSQAEITGKTQTDAYKICLSAFYFCAGDVEAPARVVPEGDREDRPSVVRHLVSSRYRLEIESEVHTCNELLDFRNWSDYW